jgi:hypothetical protein
LTQRRPSIEQRIIPMSEQRLFFFFAGTVYSIPESSSMKRNDPTHRTIEKNVTLISPSIIDALRTQSIASAMNA